jgi:UDP:flavonoid glycosyltransferase YjiC (YdhE family)
MKNIAFFITPHGFGHAARAAGVTDALRGIDPSVRFEIFTTVPKVFFEDSAGANFGYHALLTDVGLVQDSPTRENLPETLHALQRMYPFDQDLIANLANTILRLQCQLVVCDIAPMGIAVARKAGIPSVLIENFRWDWIYQHYLKVNDQFNESINYIQDVFNIADHLIQAEPVCLRREADLRTIPICRSAHTPASEVRAQLGLTPRHKAIYVSMGGSNWDAGFLRDLPNHDEYFFIVTSGNASPHRQDNLLFLNVHTYMPDILAASDVVISKLGYSTLAEVYYAGIPFGYLTRPHFPESQTLQDFVHAEMQGMHISESQFYSGAFVDQLEELLSLPRIQRDHASTGADAAARFILNLLPSIAT